MRGLAFLAEFSSLYPFPVVLAPGVEYFICIIQPLWLEPTSSILKLAMRRDFLKCWSFISAR
ncbi:hypothetical protein EPI10_033617 [Gossypium australe]|uniref:Uncharacterized protein n=1 Tax=Gossypium australe TaxID=47621 RepID=A0A5B6X8R9_9ROSI|nr:hypothetical protein EPI10_033617 [Gossypium australe]